MTRPQIRSLSRLWDLPEWMQEGACIFEGDPDWWFPENRGPVATQETRQAISICRTCPVQLQCLAYANEHHEQGIWGGSTDQQRASRRQRTWQQPPTAKERLPKCSLLSSC